MSRSPFVTTTWSLYSVNLNLRRKNVKLLAYFCADEMECLRGYAVSEEECRQQAKLQGCWEFKTLSNN